MTYSYHKPVLLQDCIKYLITNSNGTYIDATFGGGGHSREILKNISDKGRLIAFDQDKDAFDNKIESSNFLLVESNFRYLKNFCNYLNIEEVDGILADLGVSSFQFDTADRGFSFRFDALLDMRMNTEQEFSAFHLLNEYNEEKLANVFYYYGELKESRRIASIIAKYRLSNQLKTTGDLYKALERIIPFRDENQFLARVYQAIRIEVNDELEALKEMLIASQKMLKHGGRLVVMSYHSLEDKLVKQFMKEGKFEGEADKDVYGYKNTFFNVITKKPITADSEEQEKNSRSRSVKLRVAEKK